MFMVVQWYVAYEDMKFQCIVLRYGSVVLFERWRVLLNAQLGAVMRSCPLCCGNFA